MNYESALRAAALVAAAALLAEPCWPFLMERLAQAAKAARARRPELTRFAAAVLVIVAVCGVQTPPDVWAFLRHATPASVVTAIKMAVGLSFVIVGLVEITTVLQARLRTPA